MEYLTQDQHKLLMMGTIKTSKYQYLVFEDSNKDSKGKKKDNIKKTHDEKKDKQKYQ